MLVVSRRWPKRNYTNDEDERKDMEVTDCFHMEMPLVALCYYELMRVIEVRVNTGRSVKKRCCVSTGDEMGGGEVWSDGMAGW